MKVLYDYQAFAMQSFGGVSRSFAQLFSHLLEDIEYDIAIKWCSNEHLFESGVAPNVKFSLPSRVSRVISGASRSPRHIITCASGGLASGCLSGH